MAKRRKSSHKGPAHALKGGSGKPPHKKPTGQKLHGAGGANAVSRHSTETRKPQQHTEPTIPFAPEDKILLVGDGDLSFATSLIEHHYCADLTATVLEKSLQELQEKYPHVDENIAKIEAEDGKVLYGVDATKMGPYTDKKGKDGVGIMDRIIFNFPHVGGKSTDVNRQVRYNQELLVSFFQRATLSLAPGGTIVVTLFEGEPYTLWNIRDLGRHSGLQVERSFKFQASAYPGYHHARTLGVVRNKEGEIGGGWKGEERAARSYVFVRKDEAAKPIPEKTKKRRREADSESSDDE
jgi:25S rRNA (uracil2634-N3)-methyltransferase